MFAQNMDGSYESFLANSALPHAEIYALMSIIFKYSGLYVLTIIPINVMSSLATSIMITYIVKIRGGRYRIALILTALFPLSLISSYFFRDMFAMSLLTFFLVLILLTKHTKIIILVITSYLFYLQRTPYVVIPMLAYMFYTFLRSENREKSAKELVAFLIFLLLVSISFDFISEGISDLYNDNSIYTSASRKLTTYILFPIKYFTAIVGPFPWTQVLDRPENTYMFQDFILSSSLFYVTFYFFPKIFRDISYKKSIDYLAIVGVLLMMMGVMSSVSHIGYVGWGLCYLVPTIVEEFNWKNFTVFTVKYFVFMLFFNLLYKMFNLTGFMHEIMG
jgi:hypothetical protein